ncbi:arylsulfatase [Arcanobacterium hippocoleae]|uniref:Arylsulfatase A-like enzyme n=1 Tax=Arcanobacterium hippocoleae TaxID=149017 RepID=A0ABU1SZQ9_9ACTO|nr:arylsulfatase [Arcanobacterium hippocoleae]MDR6938594.1 arylsulfatase A-like enzyme [Arcanobacterium hippocoleae]
METQNKQKPLNLILLCVDQMRADAMSCAGNPIIDTPYLDALAKNGTRFTHAYSATPTCVPARVALFTGQSQERHGRVGYTEGIPFGEAYPITLPGELRKAGYQTQAIGKMHVYPERDRVGFDDVRLHDGYLHYARREHGRNLALIDDYLPWLQRQPGMAAAAETDHGIGCNSIVTRPWDKPEAYHPTNWVMNEAIDWLYRRDPTDPFFLYLSWHRPHAPYDPPQWAFDQYREAKIPDPPVGEWSKVWDEYRDDAAAEAKFGVQRPEVRARAIRGYYGSITHIDTQINRLMEALNDFDLLDHTAFVFVSDHGDMLGDHNFYRKSVGYEGSAHVPFIVKLPGEKTVPTSGAVVELRDVMPTLLDLAGVPIPDSVDGQSVLPLLRAECAEAQWRSEIHGEHFYEVFGEESMQWVTDGKRKFIWFSGSGLEQFFNLEADPQELENLIADAAYQAEIKRWRECLISYLTGREEGFVEDGKLVAGRPVVNEFAWVQQLQSGRN